MTGDSSVCLEVHLRRGLEMRLDRKARVVQEGDKERFDKGIRDYLPTAASSIEVR